MSESEEELYNKIVFLECRSEELAYSLNMHMDRSTELNRLIRIAKVKEQETQKIIDNLTVQNRELQEQVTNLEEKLIGSNERDVPSKEHRER